MLPHVVVAFTLSLPLARPPADSARAAEVRRIRAHFDSVLVELPAREPSALTPAQRARRSALLATLRAYRDRGEFPQNHDFPGQAVPYFVDRETGVPCAVAHLLAASGRRDVVDRVARADNNVWVPRLAGDTAFTGWLRESGLTLDEAARIQVPYESVSGAAVALAPVSVATALGSLTMTAVNAGSNGRGHGRVRTAIGLTMGAAAVGVGAASLAADGYPKAFSAVNLATGAASLWIATRGLARHRRDVARGREDARVASVARRAVVTPVVPVAGENGAGVAVSVPF